MLSMLELISWWVHWFLISFLFSCSASLFTLVLPLELLRVLFLSSLMDLTIVVVIIFHVGLIFLLEGPSPTLSRDTWTVHVFLIMVHVPLGQVVRCKGLRKLLLVAWLSAGFLRFISLTQHWAIDLFSSYVGDGRRVGWHVTHGFRLLTTHDRK
jgi:hypothetical protein